MYSHTGFLLPMLILIFSLARKKSSGLESAGTIRTKVFVWGLNDKDQLGGLKGSKVQMKINVQYTNLCCASYLYNLNLDGKTQKLILIPLLLHRSRCLHSLKLSLHSMWCKWLVVRRAFLQVSDNWRFIFTFPTCGLIERKLGRRAAVRAVIIYSCQSYSDSRGEDLCMWRSYQWQVGPGSLQRDHSNPPPDHCTQQLCCKESRRAFRRTPCHGFDCGREGLLLGGGR